MRAAPEVFALPEAASGLALGQLDDRREIDLALVAGRALIIIKGRDRKLSLGIKDKAQVAPAEIERHDFPAVLRAVEIGDFTGGGKAGLALLGAGGDVLILSPGKAGTAGHQLSTWRRERLANAAS